MRNSKHAPPGAPGQALRHHDNPHRAEFRIQNRDRRRAFHLELKDTYNVAAEDEPFGRWQRGEPDDYAWHQGWLDFLREVTAAGVQVQRVRVVSTPHTDYTRWGLEVARLNIQAGEDVRYLPRHLTKDIKAARG